MTNRPATLAAQLARLLDHPPTHPTHHLAIRLTTLAHLLWTTGTLATTRAHDQAPGIRAANTDPRGTGLGDPTATTAITNITHHQDDDDLDTQLRHALTELDRTTAHVCTLITKATTVHRTNDRPTNECTEALCTEAATAGRGGWCETDYARRYAWARRHRTEHPTRRDLLDAPPLTRETLADRAIRKRRQTA